MHLDKHVSSLRLLFSKQKIDELDLISILFIFVFLLSSVLETSYGVYSINFLFIIICFLIIESNYKLKKKSNNNTFNFNFTFYNQTK
jgi:hypothetical protein